MVSCSYFVNSTETSPANYLISTRFCQHGEVKLQLMVAIVTVSEDEMGLLVIT